MNLQPVHSPLSSRERIILLLTIGLAFDLRLADTLLHSYSPDQTFSMGMAGLDWPQMLAETAGDTHPPFYYALLKSCLC